MSGQLLPTPPPQTTSLWSIERVVAIFTPAFAAGAGYLFTVLTKEIPGINIPHDQFVSVFVAGATLATAAAITWLIGRSRWTRIEHEAQVISGTPIARQIETALGGHQQAIIDGVAKQIGAPASADEIAKQIVGELWPTKVAEQAKATAEA
jgi:hypothetical protein